MTSHTIPNITLESLNNLLAVVGGSWLGPWQEDMGRFIVENKNSIIQAPRQTGKTYIIALICVAHILAGKSVIVAYPTLGQSKRLLFKKIKDIISKLKVDLPRSLGTDGETKTEILWNNGASLLALSLDTRAQKEGYTADVLIIDEAHRSTDEVLGLCLPFLTQAKLRDEDKIVFLGIGGHIHSLIETQKEHVPHLKILPSEIIEAAPAYEAVFEEYSRKMPPIEYDQHILLHCVSEDSQQLFPNIPIAEPTPPEGAIYHFGIDVGEKRDYTVVTVVKQYGEYFDLIDVFKTKGSFIDESGGQEQRISEFIKQYPVRNERITIELNFNSMLHQSLNQNHFYGINGLWLKYKNKKRLSDALIQLVKQGKFRVLQEEYRKDLEGLQFDIKVDGKWCWTHSDLFSSLLMCMAAMQTAFYM